MTQITARLTSRGDTEANWTSANPVLSAKEIAFSTDAFYTGTDQQKFKVGDGTQTWTQLDYMPIGTSTQTLAQTLTNGKKTGQQTIESDNGKSILSILNTLSTMVFQDGAIYASAKVADINSALEFFNGSDGGGFYVYASKNEITHNILNEITAPENNITGHVTVTGNTSAFSDSGLVRIIVQDADGEIRASFLGGHNKVLINDVAAYLTSSNGANSASIYADAVNGNHMVNTVKNVLDAPLNEVSQDPTTALGIVTKQYVDGLVDLTFKPAGNWDASGNTFPTTGTGSGGSVQAGDVYKVSVAGTPSGFETLDVGDSFYAIIDSPGQTASNWAKFETNTQQATESARGTLAVGTQAEIEDNTSTNDIDAVTPKKFWQGWAKIKTLASQVITQFWEFLGIDFTPQTVPSYKEGRVWYDSDEKAISFYDDVSGTSIQVGQETVVRARNNTGSTVLNGQAVYISGALGQNPTIALAKGDVESTSLMIGLATHDILNNTVGKVTVIGIVRDVNTSAFSDGDALFLSPTTAGSLTNVAPSSPNFSVPIGFVAHSHGTQGKIFVRTEMPLATNTALGTSNRVAPSQNSVKSYVDALSSVYQPLGAPSIRKIVAYQNTDSTTTGSTNETVLANLAITGGDMGVNGSITVVNNLIRSGTAGITTYRMYVSTVGTNSIGNTGTPASSTLMGTFALGATVLYGGRFMRTLINKNSQSTNNSFPATATVNINDSTTSTAARTAININTANNFWVVVTAQLANSGDTCGIGEVQVEISKP